MTQKEEKYISPENQVDDELSEAILNLQIVNKKEKLSWFRFDKLPQQEIDLIKSVIYSKDDPDEEREITSWGNNLIYKQYLITVWEGGWLNDEVVNGFTSLIKTKLDDTKDRVYFMSTFFYSTLMNDGYDYSSVRRWTRKVKLSDFKRVIIPVNLDNYHWICAIVHIDQRLIRVIDSMHQEGTCLKAGKNLQQYFQDEWKDKDLKNSDKIWHLKFDSSVPKQTDGSSCGVYSCMSALHGALNIDFGFKDNDIPIIRKRMVQCLLSNVNLDYYFHAEDSDETCSTCSSSEQESN